AVANAQLYQAVQRELAERRETEARYRAVVEDQTEFICRFLPDGTLTFANEAYCRFYGKNREELIGLNLLSFLPQEEQERVHHYLGSFSPRRPVGVIEHRMVMENQEVRWQEWTYRAVFDGRGEVVEYQAVGRDITEKKRLEEHLRHLSLHDSLTGLYNRGYFEEQLRILESGRHNPVGIIVADIDGLKAVNDTRGHRAGDTLLLAAAGVLRKCFREGDIVARIGGDEFAVLLPDSPRPVVEDSCRRIQRAVEQYNQAHPELPLSISVGFAASERQPPQLEELFKQADNDMYRVKMLRRKTVV
ncbi:MAG: sensor domain-containing diguanylate cyclase, partial [Syntrophomonadaceae bacterium]|nr:sensor domain-containing diguanylate cyclase [Syntrophomonadaceae bacterium]